jgi:hypothetical protein
MKSPGNIVAISALACALYSVPVLAGECKLPIGNIVEQQREDYAARDYEARLASDAQRDSLDDVIGDVEIRVMRDLNAYLADYRLTIAEQDTLYGELDSLGRSGRRMLSPCAIDLYDKLHENLKGWDVRQPELEKYLAKQGLRVEVERGANAVRCMTTYLIAGVVYSFFGIMFFAGIEVVANYLAKLDRPKW